MDAILEGTDLDLVDLEADDLLLGEREGEEEVVERESEDDNEDPSLEDEAKGLIS